MSMDCDEESMVQTNEFEVTMKNINENNDHEFKRISYQDSMEIDNNTNKPRTLFKLLLDKRNQSKRNRKKSRNKLSNNNELKKEEDLHDKLTKEELRVVKDLKEISDSKWCARGTIVTIHLSQRLHNFKCTISPSEGYYRNGTFSFNITIDKNYPYSPPQICACHPIFHPNINLNTFEIGLPILSNDWKAVLSLNDVLFALQLLFMEPNIDPIFNNMNSNSIIKSNINKYSFGIENHKPSYIPKIVSYNNNNNNNNPSIIQNIDSAIMFRDYPIKFEQTCQQIIRGGINMFGKYWQSIQRKKMKNIFSQNNSEQYDPTIGSQSFKLKDSNTTITKKCSVLRKRRRNESDNDIFTMDNVKKALRCFASTTGSLKDGIPSDCSDQSQTSLIYGVSSIEIEPPEKKRRVELGILNPINIVQPNGIALFAGNNCNNNTITTTNNNNYNKNNYNQNNNNNNTFVAFDLPCNSSNNRNDDDDFDMQI